MEGACQAVAGGFAEAEGCPKMWTHIRHAHYLTLRIPPEHQLFTHAGDTQRPTIFNFIFFQNCIPLITNHWIPSRESAGWFPLLELIM